MKKTQLLVLLRDIRSTIVSFISVVLFVALSVSIFLGFKWNGPALGTAADTYYDSHSYHDFSITFPYGLTEEDLEAVKSLDDISVAEGGYSSSCTTTLDNNQYLLGISSLTENVDCVTVKKGRLPEKENEIGIEELFAEKAGLKIGDKLTVQSDGENDYLNCSEFTVTAIVEIPSYCNPSSDYIRGMSTIGDGIIDYCGVVSESAFNKSAFDNCYSNIYIRCDCLTDYNSLDDEYENLSNEIKNKLSAVGEIQAKKRCSNVFSRYDNGIDTAEAQISEGQELIESAKLDVAYAKNRISESKTTLTDAEAEYADGLAQYNAGAAKLAAAKPELESALVSAGFSKDIEDASNELNTAVPALKLINSALTLTVNDLNELKDKLFHTQIGVGNRLDGGRRCVKKYLWSFLRTAPAGQVRL